MRLGTPPDRWAQHLHISPPILCLSRHRPLSRVYLEETLRREGRFSAALERDAGDLLKVLGLGVKEAREMRDDLVSKAYRRAPCRAARPGYYYLPAQDHACGLCLVALARVSKDMRCG